MQIASTLRPMTLTEVPHVSLTALIDFVLLLVRNSAETGWRQ